MMDLVEITVKVPKRLIALLEAEDYFGWSKEEFFVVSVTRSISCEANELDADAMQRFYNKHGDQVDVVSFDLRARVCQSRI